MTLKELKTIVAMLNNMPDDAVIDIEIQQDFGYTITTPMQCSFTPNIKDNKITFYGESI